MALDYNGVAIDTIPPHEIALLSSLCRESFADFVVNFWHVIVPDSLVLNWHIPFICDELQKVAERVFRMEDSEGDIVINIPPGTSKSTIISIMFPAWIWTRMPECKIIGASYAYQLALDLSRKCRDVIKSDLYKRCFPEVVLSEDQDTKAYFANSKKGMRYSAGSGGAVLGFHAHIIIVDDPIDPEKAASDAEMKNTNHWISATLSGRKVSKRRTPTIFVMQRLNESDPSSVALKKKTTKHYRLPGSDKFPIAPEHLRELHYVPNGGLLDPIRIPQSVLDALMVDLGEAGYAAQIGQAPEAGSGEDFDVTKLRMWEGDGEFDRIVRYWDKAATEGGGAYTVGVKMGITKSLKIVVLDVVRKQFDSAKREALIRMTADETDGFDVMIGIEQEGAGGGKESAQLSVKSLMGYAIRVELPKGDKRLRAYPLSVQVNNGNVYLASAAWNTDYIKELRQFPNSKYKDQVDASSGAFRMLSVPKKRAGSLEL